MIIAAMYAQAVVYAGTPMSVVANSRDVSQGWLTFPVPTATDFLKIILLFTY
jgi:hypothetical protein